MGNHRLLKWPRTLPQRCVAFLVSDMASPQRENGYTAIANELLEQLIGLDIPSQELRTALFVLRKTYGYGKKEDAIALSQMQKAVGVAHKSQMSAVVGALVKKKIVTVMSGINGLTKKYQFNKDYEQWRPLIRTLTVKKQLKRGLTSSLTTKETITKEITPAASRLAMKKNRMGSYREDSAQDSHEEAIDIETGERIKPKQRKSSKHSLEIYALFGEYPKNWLWNASQRKAADALYERGIEKVKQALGFYRQHRDDEFCPRILTPFDLDSKWIKLSDYKRKNSL